MTSFELQEHLEQLLSAIGIERMLPKYIFILSRGYQHIASDLAELVYARNRTLFSQKQQSSQDQFHEIRKQAETFPLGKIFHEAIQLKEVMDETLDAFGEVDTKSLREMRVQVERFYAAFEGFARNGEDRNFSELLREAAYLYPTLINIRQMLYTLRSVFGTEGYPPRGRAQVSLFFKHTASFSAVVEKLAALERIYLELRTLALPADAEEPLRGVKIETGGASLWIRAEGEVRLIDVLGALFERFAVFMYRRLPSGAADTGISDRVLANQSLVNLTDELERTGLHQALEDEGRLQRAALMLRRDFVTLLAGSPSVRINGDEFEVPPAAWDRYIQESLHLLPRYSPVVHLEQTG